MNKLYALTLLAAATLPTSLLAQTTSGAKAEIPVGYYDGLIGKQGEALKTAIYNTIKNPDAPSYGTGENKTWWWFYITDQLEDGTYRNRYSDRRFAVGERGSRPKQDVDGNAVEMNIEHSFPKSWWGGTEGTQYNDLFNLYPSDASTNTAKLNYIMDEVASVTTDDGYTKIGSATHSSDKAWEPVDFYKGDFSRGYMYMVTAWQNSTWTSKGTQSLDNNKYPTFQAWAAELYSAWSRLDPVDEVEILRNNTIYTIQGNRNPYIDFPNLFEYLWGDSTARAFDPTQTLVAGGGTYTAGDGPIEEIDVTDPTKYDYMDVLYLAAYTTGDCGATEQTTTAPGTATSVWKRSNSYGWVANSYISGARYVSDGILYTEAIDLSNVTNAYAKFNHAVNYITSGIQQYLTAYIVCDGNAVVINDLVTWPSGTSWTFVDSDVIDISAYAGKSVQLAFRYTSDETVCGAWEIKSLEVRGGTTSSIDDITVPATAVGFDPTQPADYYRIDGRPTDSSATGLLIVRQGGHTYKIVK